MWTYQQSTGRLCYEGKLVTVGYAGRGLGKNNPAAQEMHGIGPLPVGKYRIGVPVDGTHLGPYALPLTPDPSNEMFGRGDFYIHDDSIAHPGEASEGCIVTIGVATRRTIWHSDDHDLTVLP